jgi:hypothetical protein
MTAKLPWPTIPGYADVADMDAGRYIARPIKPVAFHIGLGDPLLADATAAHGD